MAKRQESAVSNYESAREKEIRLEHQALERASKKVTKSKAAALEFLRKVGIVTKTGKLTKAYR